MYKACSFMFFGAIYFSWSHSGCAALVRPPESSVMGIRILGSDLSTRLAVRKFPARSRVISILALVSVCPIGESGSQSSRYTPTSAALAS